MKKIILSLLISNSAFALQPMVDEELGAVDGQSGITIETELMGDTTIGSLQYIDSDGNGTTHTNSAGIFLSDISIGAGSMKMEADVTAEGTFEIKMSDIIQGDLWIRKIAIGDVDTSFGAIGITNFNYDPMGSYKVKFASIDPDLDGIMEAGIILNLDMANSSFDFTFIEEAEFDLSGTAIAGNTISYTTQFDNFTATDTTIYADDSITSDGREWIRMDLGSITGSAELQNISFGSIGAGGAIVGAESIGTAGFSGIDIQDTSFIAISAH
ncbi:MAG: hypothetical protein ACI9OH_002081 [Oleispira sp.]|jgi:hypothetical protein